MVEISLSNRQRNILAALAADKEATFAPVQIQKLFFLIDNNIPEEIGGKQFNFQPYDYGPFDRGVYTELEELAQQGLVYILEHHGPGKRQYELTSSGVEQGVKELNKLSTRAQDYLNRVSVWVRSLSFSALVGTIYREYPEMRVNSVFRD